MQYENSKLRLQLKLNHYQIKTTIDDTRDYIKPFPKHTDYEDIKDEWVNILKSSGISPDELDRLSKNNLFTNLVEAIEMLAKLLIDKNLQIRILENELNTQTTKIENLTKANNSLLDQMKEYINRNNFKPIEHEIEVINLLI